MNKQWMNSSVHDVVPPVCVSSAHRCVNEKLWTKKREKKLNKRMSKRDTPAKANVRQSRNRDIEEINKQETYLEQQNVSESRSRNYSTGLEKLNKMRKVLLPDSFDPFICRIQILFGIY
jgi:hypothetical protein